MRIHQLREHFSMILFSQIQGNSAKDFKLMNNFIKTYGIMQFRRKLVRFVSFDDCKARKERTNE